MFNQKAEMNLIKKLIKNKRAKQKQSLSKHKENEIQQKRIKRKEKRLGANF